MKEPSQRRQTWLVTGLEAAHAVAGGTVARPEGHTEVSEQIIGYLRWYGDLTRTRCYWLLAEAISHCYNNGTFEKKALDQLTTQFAEESLLPIRSVKNSLRGTIYRAIGLNPTFASLVLGGLSSDITIPRFIKASARWLGEYALKTQFSTSKQREAVWYRVLRTEPFARDVPFISEEEYRMICMAQRGQSLGQIAHTLGYSEEKVKKSYEKTIAGAQHIIKDIPMLTYQKPDNEIIAILMEIGFCTSAEGVAEVEAAVRLASENADLLTNLSGKLYPALAAVLEIDSGLAAQRLHTKVQRYYSIAHRSIGKDNFYYISGLSNYSFSMKRFLMCILSYMEGRKNIDNQD